MTVELTNAQAADRLNRTLNAIWRLGDRDECSIKHVGHGLASITAGQTWRETIDYRRPWPTLDPAPQWKEDKLALCWAKVRALHDRIGDKRFRAILQDVPVAAYAPEYLSAYE